MHTYLPNSRKSRGLRKLILRMEELTWEIERQLQNKQRVRILEVGCGYGVALMDLRQRYGDRVELFGVNLKPEDGSLEIMREVTLDRYPATQGSSQDMPLPHIYHFDVCKPWPLPDNSFDIVYSQHSFLWFDDKIRTMEEINRVLSDDGIAFIDLLVKKTGSTNSHSIVIYDGDREVLFWDYIQSFDAIQLVYPRHYHYRRLIYWLCKKGFRLKFSKPRPYWSMRKSNPLDFGLEFVSAQRFLDIQQSREGIQSIYRIARPQTNSLG